MAKLYLIRHGESVANSQGVYQGQTYDTSLTKRGQLQAKFAATALSKEQISAVYSSPLKRAMGTAKIIASAFNLPVRKNWDITEMSHGLWESQTKEWVEENYHDLLTTWHHSPTLAQMPQGENVQDVLTRAKRFLNSVKEKKKNAVAVSHDVVIKLLLAHLLEMPLDDIIKLELDNCGISVVDLESFKVESVNNKLHLASLATDYSQQAL